MGKIPLEPPAERARLVGVDGRCPLQRQPVVEAGGEGPGSERARQAGVVPQKQRLLSLVRQGARSFFTEERDPTKGYYKKERRTT